MKSMIKYIAVGLVVLMMPSPAHSQQISGVEVWAQTCGNCHYTQPAARYTADKWQSIVSHMKLAARLTDEEADAVEHFLQGGAMRLMVSNEQAGEPAPVPMLASTTPMPLADIDAGALFKQYCAPCHGDGGKGDGMAAAAFNPRPADLTTPAFHQTRSDADLEAAIRDGLRNMPGFKNQLSPDQIKALVVYVRSLEKRN